MTIGIDPHKSSRTASAVDRVTNTVVALLRIDASLAGYGALLKRGRQFADNRWAIGNAKGLGYHLGQWLVARREPVFGVATTATARVRELSRGGQHNNAFGSLMSLNMAIEAPGGSDYTGTQFDEWSRAAGSPTPRSYCSLGRRVRRSPTRPETRETAGVIVLPEPFGSGGGGGPDRLSGPGSEQFRPRLVGCRPSRTASEPRLRRVRYARSGGRFEPVDGLAPSGGRPLP